MGSEPTRAGTRSPAGRGGDTPARGGRSALRAVGVWVVGLLFVALVAGVDGSPFHPLLPAGSRPWGPLAALAGAIGLDALSRDALAAAGTVAILVSVAGFLLLVREAWYGRLSLATVLVLAVAAHLLVLVLPLLFSRDVYSYAIYGRIRSVHGANPYLVVPNDVGSDPLFPLVGRQWRDTPAVYGPLFTSISAGLTKALDDVGSLITAFRLLAVGASLGLLGVVAGLVRRVRPGRAAFAAAVVGCNPVVLFHAAGGGHNDLLVGLAIAGGLWLAWRGRTLLAVAALSLGALVKAPAAIPLLLLVVAVTASHPPGRRLRAATAHAGIAVGLALAAAAPYLSWRDPSLGQIGLAGHEGWLAPSRFFRRTLGRIAEAAAGDAVASGIELAVRIAFPVVLAVALGAIVIALVRRAPVRGEDLGAAWGWALLIAMLCAPVLLPWYAAWIVPLAWLLPRVPRLGVFALSAVLAATEVVAEPLRSPPVWEAMVLGLHYVATPAAFGVLVWVLVDLRRRLRAGAPFAEPERPRMAR